MANGARQRTQRVRCDLPKRRDPASPFFHSTFDAQLAAGFGALGTLLARPRPARSKSRIVRSNSPYGQISAFCEEWQRHVQEAAIALWDAEA